MLAVTSQAGGTAYNTFKDFRIQVAGKTGTADIQDSGELANGLFVGFAPYNEPEIAVSVVIENGGSGQYATVAAIHIKNVGVALWATRTKTIKKKRGKIYEKSNKCKTKQERNKNRNIRKSNI